MSVGKFYIWPSDNIPPDHIKVSGQLLSIIQWPELFAVLGTTYGGDGISTFGLPKASGRALRHMDGGTNRDEDRNMRTDRGDGTGGDVIGSLQPHGLQYHKHLHRSSSNAQGGSVIAGTGNLNGQVRQLSSAGSGTQTHPANINMYLIVKAKP